MKYKRIYIEITNSCNLSCSFCIQNHTNKRFLNPTQFEYILKQVKPLTSYIYLHILGEPLSHPYLEELLELCDQYQFHVQITTNGTLLKKMMPILKKHKIRQFNVSVHSFKEQKFISQEMYLNDVLECCDQLSKNSYISYRLWCMKNNELDEAAAYILEKILDHYQITYDECIKHRNTLTRNRFISFDEVFEWPSLDHKFISEQGSCRGLRDMVGILSNGDIVPCCLDAYAQAKLGNIFKENLVDVLEGEKACTIKEGFLKNKLVEPLCQRCQYRTRFDC